MKKTATKAKSKKSSATKGSGKISDLKPGKDAKGGVHAYPKARGINVDF